MSIFNLNYKTQIHLRFYVLNQQTNNYMCVLCLDLNLKSKTLQIYNKIFKIKTKDYVKCSIYKKHKPNYDFICFISKFNVSKCSWLYRFVLIWIIFFIYAFLKKEVTQKSSFFKVLLLFYEIGIMQWWYFIFYSNWHLILNIIK